MSDIGPDEQPQLIPGDPLGDMIDFSGKPQPMSDQFKFATDMMRKRMMAEYVKKWERLSPLIRSTKLSTAEEVLKDAFNVFAQCMEQDQNEELSPG